MPSDLVKLRRTESELVIAPKIGGSVVSFRMAGVEILRPGSRDAQTGGDPRNLAAFPLFPFSGRIANACFRAGSKDIMLLRNFPPTPHAIDGHAWEGAWRVSAREDAAATIVFDHDAGAWPWSYRAEQRFELRDDGLSLTLRLRNLADTAMPAGLGWHPYFRRADASIQADVREIWTNGPDMIPQAPTSLSPSNDLREARAVRELDLDNAFRVGRHASVLRWRSEGLQLRLKASPELSHLVVFTPPGDEYFCVEPVSHAPNAVNSELGRAVTGLRWLQPDETLAATIRLTREMLDDLA